MRLVTALASAALPALPRHLASRMRRLAVGGAIVAGGVMAAGPGAAVSPPPTTFADVVETVMPAVVNISTTKAIDVEEMPFTPPPGSPFEDFFREFFDREGAPEQMPRRTSALGSGFVFDPEGYVVTNNHVIAEADEISVIFNNDEAYDAEVVGRDSKTDIAVLRIEGDGPFPFVPFADSDTVRVGDWVIAVGNPFGLTSTVTAGIVSAFGRDIGAGPYDDFMQVDAPINRGNSGGPSFNLAGEVIGINTAIFSHTGGNVGIGFVIPSNLARPVIESLRDDGRVKRGWLGVRIQTVTDEIAENLGLEDAEGALVASVTPGGPAETAEIRPGDVIVEFDGKTIDRMRGLPRIVAETEIGKAVDVAVWRDGEMQTLQVELGELPEDEELAALTQSDADSPMSAEIGDLGMTVATITDELRAEFELNPETSGVVIVDVLEDSEAARKKLRPGDVITEVAQEEVGSPPEVVAKINQAQQSGQSVLLLIDRQGELRFEALRFAQE